MTFTSSKENVTEPHGNVFILPLIYNETPLKKTVGNFCVLKNRTIVRSDYDGMMGRKWRLMDECTKLAPWR